MKLLLLMVLFLAGCVYLDKGEVVKTGKNSFMATAKNCDVCRSPVMKTVALANAFCESKGLVATIAETEVTPNTFGPRTATVQFVCTDIEHQGNSILRPDRGVASQEIVNH